MIEYELSSTATGVCVCCTFLEPTLTKCVVVVHQCISQLSPLGLINIESSHRFNRSGNTAYGCIDRLMTNSIDCGISVVGGKLTEQGGPEIFVAVHVHAYINILLLSCCNCQNFSHLLDNYQVQCYDKTPV